MSWTQEELPKVGETWRNLVTGRKVKIIDMEDSVVEAEYLGEGDRLPRDLLHGLDIFMGKWERVPE
jgi:hypothetical protein